MIFRGEVGTVLAGKALLLLLSRDSAVAPLARSGFLGCGWAHLDAAPSAVVAHAVDGCVADNGAVNIGVVNHGRVYVHDGGVVAKVASAPASAVEALAAVAVAVIHTAVEAHLGAPVSGVPEVGTATPTPVAGGPEQADGRGGDPGSGNPVVASGSGVPGPVAGGPHVIGSRTDGLLVDGQLGWGHGDRYSDCYLRKGRAGQHAKQRNQGKIAHTAQNLHISTFGRRLSACERIGKR